MKYKFASKGKKAGSLVFIGEQKIDVVRIRVMNIGKETLLEKECSSVSEAYNLLEHGKMAWINIDGLHDPEIFREIGDKFNVNPLQLEDIMNTDHRPKLEEDQRHVGIIVKLIAFQAEKHKITSEQLGLLVGKNYVLSFQERVGTHFEVLRNRIRQTRPRDLSLRPDYLAYALLDCVVDAYTELVVEIGNKIESIEGELSEYPKKSTALTIYRYLTTLNFLRKTVRPLKDISGSLIRLQKPGKKPDILPYFNDLNDHVIAVIDELEFQYHVVMDQFNLYNTWISNRTNEVMKTLTLFASIFIPLTFVAGIYGMNFRVIPELSWKWGYLFFWGLVILLGTGFYFFFRRKKMF